MKFHNYFNIATICVFTLIFTGCTKSKEFSFNCEVNGIVYKASYGAVNHHNNYLHINALLINADTTADIALKLTTNESGTFFLNSSNFAAKDHGACYEIIKPERRFYITDANHTGTVVITMLDEEDKLVSGTFEFQALQHEGSDVVYLKGDFENVPLNK